MAASGAAISAIYLALLLFSCCLQWGNAQTDCGTTLAGLSGCVAFLSNPSSTPDKKTCCDPLQSVLTTPASFACLCAQATSTNTQFAKNALQLPKSCKLAINVSEANCTTSKSPTTPTTPSTPGSSTATPAGNSNAGVMCASPMSAIIALAGLWFIVSLFA